MWPTVLLAVDVEPLVLVRVERERGHLVAAAGCGDDWLPEGGDADDASGTVGSNLAALPFGHELVLASVRACDRRLIAVANIVPGLECQTVGLRVEGYLGEPVVRGSPLVVDRAMARAAARRAAVGRLAGGSRVDR